MVAWDSLCQVQQYATCFDMHFHVILYYFTGDKNTEICGGMRFECMQKNMMKEISCKCVDACKNIFYGLGDQESKNMMKMTKASRSEMVDTG